MRLGHIAEDKIRYALRHKLYKDCPVTYELIKDLTMRKCFLCQMGQMRAFRRGPLTGKVYQPLECIAVDYKGPFKAHSVHGNNGFYLISDHKTSSVWVYPCKSKDEDVLLTILQSFFLQTVKRTDFTPRIFHCDDDSVETGGFISDFVLGLGLDMHVSTPYLHHQNGQVERAIQTLADKTRTLLIAGRVPWIYWDYATLMAAYIIMRSANSTNEGPRLRSSLASLQTCHAYCRSTAPECTTRLRRRDTARGTPRLGHAVSSATTTRCKTASRSCACRAARSSAGRTASSTPRVYNTT